MILTELTNKVFEKINKAIDTVANHPVTDAISKMLSGCWAFITSTSHNFAHSSLVKQTLKHIKNSGLFISQLIDSLISLISTLLLNTRNWVVDQYRSQATKLKTLVLPSKLWQYALLIRFNKPVGTLLLLWPTLISLWIAAKGTPDIDVLIVFVLGVFLMRSAGCAINDYADRKIDGKVERTKNRPLVTGQVSGEEALIIFMLLSFSAFMLVLFMNKLTIFLSVGGLILAVSYPFMKRFHYLPQVHLGAAFGWAIPMAYAAQANQLEPVTWLLFIATVLWATAYDTMYAMVDRDDDIKIGVKSTAILFGGADKLIIGVLQAALILCLLLIGLQKELSGIYYLSVIIASGFAAYQQYLIKDRGKALCFKAFLNNNWFGLVLFIGVVLEFMIGGLS